jgi:hypothetical protein
MEENRYRQVLFTLAFTLFVLCITNQGGRLISDGLWKSLAFLAFAALILFVVHYAPPLYRIAKTRPINLSRLLGAFTRYRECIRPKATAFSISETLTLPFRFQRPPPILSL